MRLTLLIGAFAAVALAQAPAAFEVVSVKPIGPVPGGGGRGTDAAGGFGGGCDARFPKLDGRRFSVVTTPYALITWAYGYNKTSGCSYVSFGDLLTGGPSWIRTERYEIQALMPEAAPDYTLDQFMKGDAPELEKMLQTMLADRFKVVVHRETKQVPGYALTQAKGGAKLTRPTDADMRMMGRRREAEVEKLTARRVEIRDLTFMLLLTTRRPVIDRTGLLGEFNFDAEFAPFDSTGDSTAPSLFTALQEQLGLRLETTKAPLEAVAIDSAERPSGN